MKFLCLGYYRPAAMRGFSKADVDALMAECDPCLAQLYADPGFVLDAGLTEEGQSMRLVDGRVVIEEEAVASQPEALGAAFLVEAADAEGAARIAAFHPTTRLARGASLGWRIVIRPIHHFKARN